MKTSAFKIIKSWLNKIKKPSGKNYLNKQTISAAIISIFILVILSYFLRPIYFDYQENKKFLQNKINTDFKLKIDFKGDISYKIFPTPRILIKDARLDFIKSSKKKIKIKKLEVLISPLNLQNFEDMHLKKILIQNQNIEIHPVDFKKYFEYLAIKKDKTLNFKNSNFFFTDAQGNKVVFENVNHKEKFSHKKHKIESNVNFSKNKVKIKFLNRIDSEKHLNIKIPGLKQYLDITFDKTSNLNSLSGELKLKFLETLLLLNFKGKEDFKISDSFLRNKFLNSKINGKISFKENFYFDLNLDVNQIDLRKFLLYYPIFQEGGTSKKINGKLNVLSKNTDSLFGKIKDSKTTLIFENGDIKIEKFSAKLRHNTKVESNISILSNNGKPIIQFSAKFFTTDANKFFRKFGIYGFTQDQISFIISGNIDVNNKKINLKEIIKDNNERINNREILIIEKSFNNNVLNDGVLGLLDFFKVKKFIQENY